MFLELTKDEELALAGVIKWVVSGDHEDSTAGIEKFFHDNGWEGYNTIYDEMDEKFENIDELKDFLITIKNDKARKIIIPGIRITMSANIISNDTEIILKFFYLSIPHRHVKRKTMNESDNGSFSLTFKSVTYCHAIYCQYHPVW